MYKRGLSEVVTAVLMILLVIAAVFIIWAVLKPTIEETLEDVEAQCLSTNLEITSVCVDTVAETIKINVLRGSGGPDAISDILVVVDGQQATGLSSDPDNQLGELESTELSGTISGVSADPTVEVAAKLGDNVCPATTYSGTVAICT